MTIKTKRIYAEQSKNDGIRIFVDRLWARGVSKENAKLDHWLKEVGPSHELRKWFGHDPDKYEEFKEKYKQELQNNKEQKEALDKLKEISKANKGNITLLFGAKEERYNQANVLKEIIL